MENSQTVQSAQTDDVIKEEAELACWEFIQQAVRKQPKGVLSEDENGKIFSFETYLREKGQSEELIRQYCDHVKSIEFFANTSKRRQNKPQNWVTFWFIIKALFFTMCPGMVLYLLIAAFFWTFEISFLNWGVFLLFALLGPFVLMAFFTTLYVRSLLKTRTVNRFILKYQDKDELTFLKSKSRLFVEK